MPCSCALTTTKPVGTKKVIIKNPKTGKKITEISVPKMVRVSKGPVLLPGLTRIMKHETFNKYVLKNRRSSI